MMLRGPSVGAVLVGVLGLPVAFVSPVAAQSPGSDLDEVYVWTGMAIGLALLLGLCIDAYVARVRARHLSLVISSLPSAVIQLDRSGRVRFLNQRARTWLGLGAGRPPFPWPVKTRLQAGDRAVPTEDGGSAIEGILGGRQLSAAPHVLSRGDQTSEDRQVRVTTSPMPGRSRAAGVLLVMDEMPLQSAPGSVSSEGMSRDLFTNLAQRIANDINNTLATIAYAIDLSLKQSLPEKASSLLMTALTTIERGQDTTERMQNLARMSNGQTASRSVLALFEGVRAQIPEALDGHVALDIECDAPDLMVKCDPARLEQILLALTRAAHSAARSGTEAGHVTLAARMSQDPAQVSVELSILTAGRNTGAAIWPELEAARAFATEAQGALVAPLSEGAVSTIRLRLPAERLAAYPGPNRAAPALRGNGETVFLVEDEPMLLLMLQEELEDLGYRVISATSGKAAIGLIEQGVEFDLVIADVVMPGNINGFDLANTIRKKRHRAAVLYMSGYSGFTPEDMGDAKAPILKKPCPPNELAHAVQSALKVRLM